MAARSQGGTPGKLYDLGRYEEAETTFGKEDALTALVKLLMANGAARVLAVPVEEEADYPAAFALLGEQESVKVVVCDSQTLSVQQALRDQVLADAQVRRERIAVVPGGAEESVSQLVARAKELNSERVVLVAPGISDVYKRQPFLSGVLLKIYQTLGANWERAGNVRFAAVSYTHLAYRRWPGAGR